MQVRVPSSEVAQIIRSLVDGVITWAHAQAKYPAQAAPAATEEGDAE